MCLGETAPLQAETRVNSWVLPTCEKAGSQALGWSFPSHLPQHRPLWALVRNQLGRKWVVPTPTYELQSAEKTALKLSSEKSQSSVLDFLAADIPGDMLGASPLV